MVDARQVPDRRAQLHGGQHRAHRRHPPRQEVGRAPASGSTSGSKSGVEAERSRLARACRRTRACPWDGGASPVPGRVGAPAVPASPASGAGGSAMASRRNRQSSTVCHAHAPGATAAISMVAPVGVSGRPVSSATCSSAMWASSSNLIRSAGSTLRSGSPPLATPCARVRARSMRAPPDGRAAHELEQVAEDLLQEVAARARAGNATPGIVGGAHRLRSAPGVGAPWRRPR